MDKELLAVMKSLTSTGHLAVALHCQIEAMEAVLEHYAPDAFRDYQYKLHDLYQEQIKLGRLPNRSAGSKEPAETSNG